MIPDALVPRVKALWPLVVEAAKRHGIPELATLLLAIAWVESRLDPKRVSDRGRGLLQMTSTTAATVAAGLGHSRWNLLNRATALDFGAFHLARQLERFTRPAAAVCAFHFGPDAVARAGGTVPRTFCAHRHARNVLRMWEWLRGNLVELLQRPEPPRDGRWRLVLQGDRASAEVIPKAALPVVERIAERLALAYHRDDAGRCVELGLPRVDAERKPPCMEAPALGATRSSYSDAYETGQGIDLLLPVGTPVIAVGDGTVIRSEGGFVLLALHRGFPYKRNDYRFAWYAHLWLLRFHEPGAQVNKGELLGWSGIANAIPELGFGLAADAELTECLPMMQLAAMFGWLGGGGR